MVKYSNLKIGDSIYMVDTIHRKNTSVRGILFGRYTVQLFNSSGYPVTHEGIILNENTVCFDNKEEAKLYLKEIFELLYIKL